MVDLPTGDESGDVTAQAPVNRVSGRQYAMAGSYLAQGLNRLSDGLDKVAVPLAEQAGQQAAAASTVTKDAQGNTIVRTPASLPILGAGGVAYDAAVAAGTLARGNNQVDQDLTAIRTAQPTAAGFKQASTAYIASLQANNPGPLGQTMAGAAAKVATQHYDGMVVDEANQHISDSKSEINTAMSSKFNTLTALASQGATDTAQFGEAAADYNSLSKQLTANPAFGVDPKLQASNDAAAFDQLHAYSISGSIDRTWNGPGGPAAAKKQAYDQINDPSLDLSPAQRQHFQSVVDGRIQFNAGQNAAASEANRQDVGALRQMATDPTRLANLSEPNFQAAIAKSTSLGDTETVQNLVNSQLVWRNSMANRGVAPNQAAINQGVPTASNPPAPSAGPPVSTPQGLASYKARVAQIESGSGSNEGGLNSYYQFEPATWAKVAGPGDTKGTAAGEDAAMNALTSDNRNALVGGLGREPTQAELYLAHQQGAQGAMKLMADPSRRAGDVVGDAAINGNGGNSSMTAGQFVNMWQARFSKTPVPPSTGLASSTVPFTPAQLQANPGLFSTWAASTAGDKETRFKYGESLGTAIEQSMNAGMVPPINSAATFFQIAQDEPRLQPQAQKLVVGMQGASMAANAINLPPGQGPAYMQHVEQVARTSPDLMQQQLALSMQHAFDQKTEAIKKDPFGTAIAEGWDNGKGAPGPLNFNDPLALGVAMHQRSDLASSIAARTGDLTAPALSPDEVPQVKSVLANGSQAQISNLSQAIGSLPEARQKATWAAIGQSGQDGRVFAVSGNLQRDAPQVAADILQGQALLKDKDELAPKPVMANATLNTYMPVALFDAGARQTVGDAVRALYAKMNADANDASGVFNYPNYQQAVTAVTGGIVNHRGNQLVAPWYGASQGDFTDALNSVTPDDMKGSVTRDGSPLAPAMLKPSFSDHFYGSRGFKLENNGIGDGQYRIYSGADNAKAYVKDAAGKPFLLNLGAKRAAVAAHAAALAQPEFNSGQF